MKLPNRLETAFNPVNVLVKLLTCLRKLIEKYLTQKTVNELVTLIVHVLVILAVQWFIAILLK